MSNKRYNNPLGHLTTGVTQRLKVKLYTRLGFMTLP
jgi:hypothetical protein